MHVLRTILYFTVLGLLACYGLHRYVMLFLYYRHRRRKIEPRARFAELPLITVQLPLYNEMYVAERLLNAVAALDYPREKLQIQVLDDSTDETSEIVARKTAQLRDAGFDIVHVRRPHRLGFKAGALENGLRSAKGEFIAIFDADFVPQPDLFHRTIHFFTDPGVGMIQTRWGHLNARYSLLTQLQSMFLDGHLLIEQTARSRSGLFFNFNGTAGLWRRSCIEASGGWQPDTLAEDLDLSYRAQIKGWRFVFLPDIVTPAELPVEMNAFKIQLHRWAKGSIQTCKKVLPLLWRSPAPLKVKLEGTIHLTSNFGHVLLLVLSCLLHPVAVPPQMATGGNPWTKMLLVDLPLFFAASLSISAFYCAAQVELYRQWWKRLVYIPVLMAMGIGLSINNTRAVLEGLFNYRHEFVRTPKWGVTGHQRIGRGYQTFCGLVPYLELAFGLYCTWLLALALERDQWMTIPFVAVFQCGFLYVALPSLLPTWSRFWKRPTSNLLPANA